MIIISDTSCISALVRIGRLELLRDVFEQIVIPKKVHEELLKLDDFGIDTSIFAAQNWIRILQPQPSPILKTLLSELDEGEAHAIALGLELHADVFLTDDMLARKAAETHHFTVIGIGGILIRAKKAGFIIEVKPMLDKIITTTNFRLSTKIYNLILDLADESQT